MFLDLGLALAMLVSFALIAGAAPGREPSRKAPAGAPFWLTFTGYVSNCPNALMGHHAAPIFVFGRALGLLAASGTGTRSADYPATTGV